MTENIDLLHNYRPTNISQVQIANKIEVLVLGFDFAHISDDIVLDILYVPKCT